MRWVFVVALGACAHPVAPPRSELAELTTVAAVGGDGLWTVFGAPIAPGGHYAVVDDAGYVGTLRARAVRPCHLACVGCCAKPEWTTAWVDPPGRSRREGLVLAVGPVLGQYTSVRRDIPAAVGGGDADGNPWSWSFVRTPEPQTLVRFTFASAPTVLEVRGQRVDGGRVIEIRRLEDGAWRTVSRTTESDTPRMLTNASRARACARCARAADASPSFGGPSRLR